MTAFNVFTERLLRTSETQYPGPLANELNGVLWKFISTGEVDAHREVCISYLKKEFEALGIDKMPQQKFQDLEITFAQSTSCGWGIQTESDRVFVRFSEVEKETRIGDYIMPPPSRERPYIVTGVNNLRSYTSSSSDMLIETHPFVRSISDVPELEDMFIYNTMMTFSDRILRECNFGGLYRKELFYEGRLFGPMVENKIRDFGVRFFEKEQGVWKPVNLQSGAQVNYEDDLQITHEGKRIVAVPYLYDTELLKGDASINAAAQTESLCRLLDNKGQIENLDVAGLSPETRQDMIECYIAFEKAQNTYIYNT